MLASRDELSGVVEGLLHDSLNILGQDVVELLLNQTLPNVDHPVHQLLEDVPSDL